VGARARLLLAKSLSEQRTELLPLRLTSGHSQYFAVNLLPCYDCIDIERSAWRSLPSLPHWYIEKHVFRRELIPPFPVFKASAAPSTVFALSEFMDLVEAHGLTGVSLTEAWSG
jgi:hypothetical protein